MKQDGMFLAMDGEGGDCMQDFQDNEKLKEPSIANMSMLDFLTLLWEARIVGAEYVHDQTDS